MDAVKLVVGILASSIVIIVAITIFDAIATSGQAPQTGDPFYPAWRNLTVSLGDALALVAGGTIAVLAFIASQFRSS